MRWIITLAVLVLSYLFIFMGWNVVEQQNFNRRLYKNALDSACDAAVSFRTYNSEEYMDNIGYGFGTGELHSFNIKINTDDSLKWFYRVFFKNLGIYSSDMQTEFKRYIPMKAIISYDKIMIADADDNWVVDQKYEIEYAGILYNFTLSDQVYNTVTMSWLRSSDIGLSTSERHEIVNSYINNIINNFLNNRKYQNSDKYYSINIALSDADFKTSSVNGVNFLSVVEGMPIRSFNPLEGKKGTYYALSFSGSELKREE